MANIYHARVLGSNLILMPYKVLIPVSENYETGRKASLINNIKYWANSRSVGVDIVKPSKQDGIDLSQYAFAYAPLTLNTDSSYIDRLKELPFVVDRATPVKPTAVNPFEGCRLAVRNAFGQDVSTWKPQQQIPMLPPPLGIGKDKQARSSVKDIIIFDVKQFHSYSTHLYIASLLANTIAALSKVEKKIDLKLNIYFTSYFDWSLYLSLFDTLSSNDSIAHKKPDVDLIAELKSRVLPPVESHDEYLQYFSRCRLFLTEHGDIADSDLVHALLHGIPTLTYSRDPFATTNGFQASTKKALQYLSPDLLSHLFCLNDIRIKESCGCEFALSLESVPRLNFSVYEEAYLMTWDIVYEWACNDNVDDKLNHLMTLGSWNRGVTLSSSEKNRISAYIKTYRQDV